MSDGALQRILYVEDDADVRKIVSMSLEMVGEYTVAACGSCAEALRVVDEFSPDLLLLDGAGRRHGAVPTARRARRDRQAVRSNGIV